MSSLGFILYVGQVGITKFVIESDRAPFSANLHVSCFIRVHGLRRHLVALRLYHAPDHYIPPFTMLPSLVVTLGVGEMKTDF